jgi:hypothetical protein
MLARFEVWQTGRYDAVPPDRRGRVLSLRPADPEYDTAYWTGPAVAYSISAIKFNHTFAQEAFAQANEGRSATRAEELMPFLKWPVSVRALQKAIDAARGAP